MMIFSTKKFCQKYKKSSLGFEVGKISQLLAEKLLSKSVIVIMSEETLAKNLRHHPDLDEEEYLKLDMILGKSHFIVKDGNKMLAVVLEETRLYHYALKSTKSGKALFLTSFRRTNKISIEKIRKKCKQGKVVILKDNLP